MSYYNDNDNSSKIRDDINYSHTPDSVRDAGKAELERRGESGNTRYGGYGNPYKRDSEDKKRSG